MRDPELAARAQRAATRLESGWEDWRARHGLAIAQVTLQQAQQQIPIQPVPHQPGSSPRGRPACRRARTSRWPAGNAGRAQHIHLISGFTAAS